MELTIGNKKQFILLNKNIPNFTCNFSVQSKNNQDVFNAFIINSEEAKFIDQIQDKLSPVTSKDGLLTGIKNINNNVNKLDYYLVIYSKKIIQVFVQINTKSLTLTNKQNNNQHSRLTGLTAPSGNVPGQIEIPGNGANSFQGNLVSSQNQPIPINNQMLFNQPGNNNIINLDESGKLTIKIPFYKNKKIIIIVIIIILLLMWYYFIYKKNNIPFIGKYFNKSDSTDNIQDSYMIKSGINENINLTNPLIINKESQGDISTRGNTRPIDLMEVSPQQPTSLQAGNSQDTNINKISTQTAGITARDGNSLQQSNLVQTDIGDTLIQNNSITNKVVPQVHNTTTQITQGHNVLPQTQNLGAIINDTVINNPTTVHPKITDIPQPQNSILDRINNL